MRRAARATALILLVTVGTSTVGVAQAGGRFTCASPGTAVPGLSDVSISPDTVQSSARTVSLSARLATDSTDVTFVLYDGGGPLLRAAGVASVAGRFTAAVEVPESTTRGVLGMEVRWVDADGSSRAAAPCDLMAAGHPYQVFVDPVPPSAPVSVTAQPGDRAAEIRWLPGEDGFSPITSWTIQIDPGGVTRVVDGSVRSTSFADLDNGRAYRFSVTAANRRGAGPAATSAAMVPRLPSALRPLTQVVAVVRHGVRTSVTAQLADLDGDPVADRPVQLLAMPTGSATWSVVATGLTDGKGQVPFNVALSRTSALRLSHPADDVATSRHDLGRVSVVQRLTATSSVARAGVGVPVAVRGSLFPSRRSAVVTLQQWSGKAWASTASARTTSSGGYAFSWRAKAAGTTALRVVAPATDGLLTGASPQLKMTAFDTVVSLAKAILADRRITLSRVHGSGARDQASAWHNLGDLAAGRQARRSSQGNAPGGTTAVDIRVLRALRLLSRSATFTVTEVAGGSHARRSSHYRGLAIDITVISGRRVGSGSGHLIAVRACESAGATAVWSPSHDPYGGHSRHVHCDWAVR